ncbi:glycosyltransferase 87 family protein [Salinispora tropica]|uniref:glycosyltransferase 87 family protein n=1 Tax=Salinispora tropica TaxID=168695 RepID=UPI00048ABBD5|nr:glycosyltransferase 87 family protein [Salinispora tropica]
MTSATPTVRRGWPALDHAAGGLAVDLALYGASAGFAAATTLTSTLAPHRAWGNVATAGYLVAAVAATAQLLIWRRRPGSPLTGLSTRWVVAGLAAATTVLLPVLWQSTERAFGRTDRAQEEVIVIEDSGRRLIETGTPYLSREAIAALPTSEQLLGYTPYQPGMALFGLPRAIVDTALTDARVWFALATVAILALAGRTLWRADARDPHPPGSGILRGVQAATILPVSALTLATGGDDLPVLALCLLALTLAAAGRPGRAGAAVGLAAALKLFAWPVVVVLAVWGATRRSGRRVLAGALGLPAIALLPVLLIDPDALVENVLRFPLGQGLVTSPAQSPLPGHLISTALPAGRLLTGGLLLAVGLVFALRLTRRPPRTAAAASLVCGYGLLVALLLMPASRFGYLLYPLAFLIWAPALARRNPATRHGAASHGVHLRGDHLS